METLLGLIMIYFWVHGVVIVVKKIENTTYYENIALWIGFGFLVLFIIGATS